VLTSRPIFIISILLKVFNWLLNDYRLRSCGLKWISGLRKEP
jgi:hypothetical protein